MAGLLRSARSTRPSPARRRASSATPGLVKKVRFPLLVPAAVGVGFAMVQLALQMPVLLLIALVSGVNFFGPPLLLIVPRWPCSWSSRPRSAC
jgi:hypothetical protein